MLERRKPIAPMGALALELFEAKTVETKAASIPASAAHSIARLECALAVCISKCPRHFRAPLKRASGQ